MVSCYPKNQISVSVRISSPCLNVCEHTQLLRRESEHRSLITDEPSASAADPQTLPPSLCLTQSLPQCRAQPDHQQPSLVSLSYYGVSGSASQSGTSLYPLGVEGD
ncbi:hypothetical protein QQF64_021073 [Cirrhinus molitorella]|uniref:Uncharacterized protein n=1 Tax=Cirrhinus molitorella TaxID=172907 RepID=A0ABR3LEX3_9TELE